MITIFFPHIFYYYSLLYIFIFIIIESKFNKKGNYKYQYNKVDIFLETLQIHQRTVNTID